MNHIRFHRPARHHLHFPRTSREACGYDLFPLSTRITFIDRPRTGWLSLAATVLLLAVVFILFGEVK